MMNIFEQQAKAMQQVRESGKVIPFPTQELARQMHAEGKRIVHKPNSKQCVFDDNDFPPEAA